MARKPPSGLTNAGPNVAGAGSVLPEHSGSRRTVIARPSPPVASGRHRGWLRRWLPGWLTPRHREGMPPSIAYTGTGILPLPPHASVIRAESTQRGRRCMRQVVSRAGPKEFTPFLVARWGARPVHSRASMGPPSFVIALGGAHELGGVELVVTMVKAGRPGAGASIERPDPAIATRSRPHRLMACQMRAEIARDLAELRGAATALLPTRSASSSRSCCPTSHPTEVESERDRAKSCRARNPRGCLGARRTRRIVFRAKRQRGGVGQPSRCAGDNQRAG